MFSTPLRGHGNPHVHETHPSGLDTLSSHVYETHPSGPAATSPCVRGGNPYHYEFLPLDKGRCLKGRGVGLRWQAGE